jgi:phosphate:Na+ symporter
MELAARKIRRKLRFSDEGTAEITGMLERLLETQRLAAAVFMSGDVRSARMLMREKAWRHLRQKVVVVPLKF